MNHQLIVISLLDGKGPTGVEIHVNQLLQHARAHGIDSTLVSPYPSQRLWAALARRAAALLGLFDRERAAVLSLWINSQVIGAKLAPLLARAGQRGAAITLYAHDPVCALRAHRASRTRACRVVTVIHYTAPQADELALQDLTAPGRPLWRWLTAAEAAALPHMDHIIFASAFMQAQIGARMAAVRAVPQSVIPPFIGQPSLPADGGPDGDLIAIGTLEARMNQAFLLHVVARARAHGLHCTLTLVGDGPDRAMLVALAEQLGLRDQVTFAGQQPQAARLIARHRWLVHAALIDNLPITLIEALAAGRPILAPQVGAIGEIFRHGVEGYAWPLDDVARAATLLAAALSEPDAYRRMAPAARARYLEHFGSAPLTGRWLSTLLHQPAQAAVCATHRSTALTPSAEGAGNPARPTIAVILTCFNRRQKTLACIDAVLAQTALTDVLLDFFITDDASHDGTADALMGKSGRMHVLKGNGTLFWNGGMRLAWSQALTGDFDFYLWLNDDTFLYPQTLRCMLDTHALAQRASGKPGIVVGSTHDDRGQTSYGGERQRSRLRPLTLARIDPQDTVQQCDTYNGNCVLVSRQAAHVLGNLDAGFVHAMGDTDYGLRARKAGIPMWVMPGYAGRCINDSAMAGGFDDASLPLMARLTKMLSPKGLPWRPWRLLCRRHAGLLWPLYWCWPYLKVIATAWPIRRRSARVS